MLLISGCGHEFRPADVAQTPQSTATITSGTTVEVGFSCLDSITYQPVTAEVTIGLCRALTTTGYVTFTGLTSGLYQLVVFTRDYDTYYCEIEVYPTRSNFTVLLKKRTYRTDAVREGS